MLGNAKVSTLAPALAPAVFNDPVVTQVALLIVTGGDDVACIHAESSQGYGFRGGWSRYD